MNEELELLLALEREGNLPPEYQTILQGYRNQGIAKPLSDANSPKVGKQLRQGDADRLESQVSVYSLLKNSAQTFDDNFSGNALTGELENFAQGIFGTGTPGQRDWWSQFREFDNLHRNELFGASLTAGEKNAYAQTTVTPRMTPSEVKKNVLRRAEIVRTALERRTDRLRAAGWNEPEIQAAVGEYGADFGVDIPWQQKSKPVDFRQDDVDDAQPPANRNSANPQSGGLQSSTKVGNTFNAAAPYTLATGQTAAVPIPPEMQAEYDQFVASNRGRISPEDYAQFRIEQNQKYGFGFNPGDVQKYIQEGQRINNPRNDINTNIPSPEGEVGAVEGALTGAASTGAGAAALTYLNSAGLGIPGALAGNEKINAIQDESPTGSFFGNLAGGLTGTAALTKGALALGAKSIPNALTGANLAYGGAVGAAGDTENPLLGAATGLGVSTIGQGIGQFALGPALGRIATSGAANRARGILGGRALPRSPKLTGSENNLASAIGNDGRAISQTLGEANRLGVPITLADTTPALRSLGGASVRRSTDAKALAEGVFEPRQIGQIDRLQSALNRDLGPVGNIPQLSDDLIKKGRADSGPLYDQYRSSPGASSVNAAEILSRPIGKDALTRAYTAILNRGGTPETMGFNLNDAGEVVLSKTPSFDTLDRVRRSFDKIAQTGDLNPLTGKPVGDDIQSAANASARDLNAEIDKVNPFYAQARAAFAGPAGEKEALTQGTKFSRLSTDENDFIFKSLSPSKQGQYRLGARSDISNQADNVRFSSNPFDKVLGTPAAQQKISTLFPEGAGNLIRQTELERMLAKSKQEIIGNSLTAERGIADEAFNLSPGATAAIDGAVAIGAGGPPVLTASRLLGGLSKDSIKMGFGKKKANELGAILFDQENAAKALRDISVKKRQSGILGRKARRKNRAVGGAVGAALSAPIIADN